MHEKFKELEKMDKTYLWHPYTQMKDWMPQEIFVVERGEGFYLIDVRGRKLIDGVASIWCNVWGHGKRELVDEIVKQAGKLQHSTLLGMSNVPAIKLAKKLADISPGDLKRVFYTENGASAVEVALKMALQFWKNQGADKSSFVTIENGYHGDTAGAMSVSGTEFFFSSYEPLLFKPLKAPSPYCYRCDKKECDDSCFQSLAEVVERNEVAAVMMESKVQMAGGGIVFPDGYMKRVEKLCRKNDTLLILDEIATGLGRLGRMFACELEDVVPDILTIGKMLSGGYLPISAVLTTEKVFNAFLGEYHEGKMLAHGHTFTGNPICCSVALKNLELYEKESLIERVKEKARILEEELEDFWSYRAVGDVRSLGLFAAIELVKDRETKEPFTAEDGINYRITEYAARRGVFLRPIVNVIFIMPPLAVDDKTLLKILDAARFAVERISEGLR